MERADAEQEHMGLTTWENAPDGKIVKTDVVIAKNYLNELELEDMGQLVNDLKNIELFRIVCSKATLINT